MSKALQLGKWVPRQQSQALPPLQCHFSPSVLLNQASCPQEIGIQYSTTQACHRTHSQSQRHICSFLSDPKGALWVVRLGSLAGSGDTSVWWEGAAGLGSRSLPKADLSTLCYLRGPLGFPYPITSLFVPKWHCLIEI